MAYPSESKASHLIPVRPGESFDVDSVQKYLHDHGVALSGQSLHVTQFPAGASNLTYLLSSDTWQGVLRRPPLGPLPPKAHDMEREFRLLEQLHPVFPLAPKPYVFCADESLIGSPFYVMEYRHGVVVDDVFPPHVEVTESLIKSMVDAAVDTLVQLHQIDYKSAGLDGLGRPQGFLARQVQGWVERYNRAKTHVIPEVEPLITWLASQLPGDSEATLIHNDFKLNNMIFAPNDLSQVVAVVDWEMATLGDPLLDLAVTMSYWIEDDDPAALKQMLPTVTKLPGFPTRSDFIAQYAAKSGRDVSNIQYYLVFAYFKLAVILQQIYYRYRQGQTQDERFATFHLGVRSLIAHAYSLSMKA